jgi:hypothetical protein
MKFKERQKTEAQSQIRSDLLAVLADLKPIFRKPPKMVDGAWSSSTTDKLLIPSLEPPSRSTGEVLSIQTVRTLLMISNSIVAVPVPP